MTNLENYQLVHPELLTEDTLLQVLKDRCIQVPQLKSTGKAELVEIFKRVALPLPQRKYNDSTHLGRKLISLRKSRGQQGSDVSNDAPSSSRSNGSVPEQVKRSTDGLKPSLVVSGTESKKIRLSKSSPTARTPCDVNKRRGEENLRESPGCKKRQKITWP